MAGIHDVRWYHGDMVGVPALGQRFNNTSTANKVNTVLSACLVDGFNLNTVNSISVASGVATVVTAANHNFTPLTVIRIEGATPAGLNGDWKIDNCINNSFTFPTAVADGAATGTMSAKTAPLGWSKPFVDANVSVYKGVGSSARFLQVNDPTQYTTRMRGFRDMTSATVGSNPFPTAAQETLGIGLLKTMGTAANETWYLVGDGNGFYLIFDVGGSAGVRSTLGPAVYGFGEVLSYVPNDEGRTVIIGLGGANGDTTAVDSNFYNYHGFGFLGTIEGSTQFGTNSAKGMYLETNYTQTLGAPAATRLFGHGANSGWGSNAGNLAPPNPNLGDGSLLLHTPVLMQEVSSRCIRAALPGTYQILNSGVPASKHGTFELVNGRNVLFLKAPDFSDTGLMGIDITGPWR